MQSLVIYCSNQWVSQQTDNLGNIIQRPNDISGQLFPSSCWSRHRAEWCCMSNSSVIVLETGGTRLDGIFKLTFHARLPVQIPQSLLCAYHPLMSGMRQMGELWLQSFQNDHSMCATNYVSILYSQLILEMMIWCHSRIQAFCATRPSLFNAVLYLMKDRTGITSRLQLLYSNSCHFRRQYSQHLRLLVSAVISCWKWKSGQTISCHIVSTRFVFYVVIKTQGACRLSSNSDTCMFLHESSVDKGLWSVQSEVTAPEIGTPCFCNRNTYQGLFFCCRVLPFTVGQCSRCESSCSFSTAMTLSKHSTNAIIWSIHRDGW